MLSVPYIEQASVLFLCSLTVVIVKHMCGYSKTHIHLVN